MHSCSLYLHLRCYRVRKGDGYAQLARRNLLQPHELATGMELNMPLDAHHF